jgi:hypothetical protein
MWNQPQGRCKHGGRTSEPYPGHGSFTEVANQLAHGLVTERLAAVSMCFPR